jgi:DNA polymerase-3 subunit alpha
MAGAMSRNLDKITEITKLMQECKSMGINVLGPDVNESRRKFSVNKAGDVRFGLCAVKGVGENAVQCIIDEREANGPFTSIFDFVERVNLTACNRKNLECLAFAGAFDELPGGITREQYAGVNSKGEQFIEALVRYGNLYQTDKANAGASLFGDTEMAEIPKPEIPVGNNWSTLERLNRERELVGIYLSAHPLDDYALILNEFCNTKAAEVENMQALVGRKITLGGVVSDPPRTGFTKKGSPYGVARIEDFSGTAELFFLGEDWMKKQNYFIPGNFLYIKGSCQPRKWDQTKFDFVVDSIELMPEIKDGMVKSLTLTFDIMSLTDELYSTIIDYAENHPGKSKLMFKIKDYEQEFTLELASKSHEIEVQQQFIDYIKSLENIEYSFN